MTIIEDAVRTMREAQIELARLREINAELLEALKTLVLVISPDYSIEAQESYFHKPLKQALDAIFKAEGGK